jgi:hypothetical protein
MQSMKGNERSPVLSPQGLNGDHATEVAGAGMAGNKTSGEVNGLYSPILSLAVWLTLMV